MKTILETNSNKNSYVTEFISYNDKTFRISYTNINGRSELSADIMKGDGTFEAILWKHIIGNNFEFVSYVSSDSQKMYNAQQGIKIVKQIIKKLY